MNKPKTIFLDIDGTLIFHHGNVSMQLSQKPILLPGTIEKLNEWDKKGYNIILTTGRRESCRKQTENQLSELGIFYDYLIMGIGGGDRIIVNDRKPNSQEDTAAFFCLQRNVGISSINI